MLSAVVDDFSRAGFAVASTLQADCNQNAVTVVPAPYAHWLSVSDRSDVREIFRREAAKADWTLVIAPEFDALLADYCDTAVAVGGRVLNARRDLVALAADKQATAQFLASRRIRTPDGIAIRRYDSTDWREFHYPAVLKPRFGAGSQQVRLVRSADEVERILLEGDQPWRLEALCQGRAASVSFLCGGGQTIALPPCAQSLSLDGRFTYLGGRCPIDEHLAARARDIAQRAVAALAADRGYVGVDLVLGEADDGSQDFVIEINPRLTTSYVGLRAICRENLAAAIITAAEEEAVALTFEATAVEFSADGSVRPITQASSTRTSNFA